MIVAHCFGPGPKYVGASEGLVIKTLAMISIRAFLLSGCATARTFSTEIISGNSEQVAVRAGKAGNPGKEA